MEEPQLLGKCWGGQGACPTAGATCAPALCHTSAAGAPSRHILCILHKHQFLLSLGRHCVPPLPAPPQGQAVAHDVSPSSHSPGSLKEPLQKRNCMVCQKQRWLLKHPVGLWACGVRAPLFLLPSSSLCELLCGFPPPAVTDLLTFFLQKRLKIPASQPSVTGPTWRTLSS